jgi:hypothetical protein
VWEGDRVIFKALLFAALLFIAVGMVGIWLRRRRGR